LAIIGPNLYRVLIETKQDKLIQYGERVWNICSGTPTERANQAIDKTTAFFHQLGVPTKLSEYTPDYAQTADFIVKRFEQRGWIALGERQNIDLIKLRRIVEMSY
jgi:NADP-dependent alcohol dehydrogenase